MNCEKLLPEDPGIKLGTERLWLYPVSDAEMEALIARETDPENRASQRGLERAGLLPDGSFGEEGPRFVRFPRAPGRPKTEPTG